MKKSILRIVSMILSIALIVGCINIGVFASQNDPTITLSSSVSETTDAKIIAGYYDFLSELEKAVLHCTALVGGTHTITAPTDSDKDGLITVDTENKTVEVKSFTKDGYTWNPVSAQVIYQDNAGIDQEPINVTLTNGVGSFECSSDRYRVEVTYELKVAIDTTLQQTLVNAPAYLANGIVNMNAVAQMSGNFETVASNLDTLVKFVDGVEFGNGAGLQIVGETAAAIMALKTDRDANSDANSSEKKFAINKYIDAYNAYENKVEYLLANGEEFKVAFENVMTNLGIVVNDKTLQVYIDLAVQNKLVDASAQTAFSALTGIYNTMAAVDPANWAVLEQELVKADAIDAELTALDSAVCDLAENGTTALHNDETFDAEVLAGSVTLTQGVDQYKVTVVVKAQVVTGVDAELKPVLSTLVSTATTSLVFDKDTSSETIQDAIKANGVLATAVSGWDASYEINETNYTVEFAGLSEKLTADVTCTVTYVPNVCVVDLGYGDDLGVPYGYRYTLPTYASENNGDTSKSYDYTVNGKAMREGVAYRVVGNTTITRVEGKATESVRLPEVVANSYKPGSDLETEAKAILYASAIKGDNLYFRTPSDDLELVTVEGKDGVYTVTAENLASGLTSGAEWVATKGYLVDADNNKIDSVEISFDANGKGAFNYTGAFKEVKVEYELTVEEADVKNDVVNDYINLPNVLVAEAKAQKELLAPLASDTVYKNFASINEKYNMITALITTELGFSQKAVDAADEMKKVCVDTQNKSFYLYQYLTSYRADGLAFLYTGNNSEKMKEQILALADALGIIAEEDAFETLLIENGFGEYVDKIDDLVNKLDYIKNNIDVLDVNSYIDTNSDYIEKLVEAIEAADGKVAEFSATELVLSATVGAVTSGTTTLTVNVQVKNSAGQIDASSKVNENLTFAVGQTITPEDITNIYNLISKLNGTLTIDKDLYMSTTEGAIPSEGDTITSKTTITITWEPVTYTVKIDGEEDKTFSSDSAKIMLPACTLDGYKYIYTVGNRTITVTSSEVECKFEVSELKSLFDENRELTITRVAVEIAREDILNFVADMNSALKTSGLDASFVAMEDENGKIAIVLRVSSSVANATKSQLTSAVEEMAKVLGTHEYVGLNGEAFWNGSAASVQTIIDMVADSGFGFDSICNVIDENGNIIDMTLDGYSVVGNTSGALGGKLMETTLELDSETNSYPLYITMAGGSADALLQIKETLTTIKNYVNLECTNGKYNIIVNAPDSVYPYYLAEMLLLGKTDIKDINAMDLGECLAYELSLVKPFFANDSFTVETIENTLAKLGKDVDLSAYADTFVTVRKAINYLLVNADVEGSSEGSVYTGTIGYGIRDVLLNLGVSDTLLNFVAEASETSEGVTADFSVKLVNMDVDYDAIIFDYSAEGILNKFYVTTDLASSLAGLGEKSVVVLLSDVVLDSAVTISNNVFINLNGYTINGDMNAAGAVRITDGRVGTDDAGSVNGNLTGNFVITGGQYSCDISSMLKKGYSVDENGYVSNNVYTVEEDENGNITIILAADFLDRANFPELKSLLVDVAFDVAFNMYTTSELSVDGNMLYSVSVTDVLSYLDSTKTDLANTALGFVDWEGLTTALNTIIEDVFDFGALASAIENDKAVAAYEITAKAWDINTYVADGNYITLDIIPSDETKTGTLSVVVAGTDEEKAALAELCEKLSETVDIESVKINVTDVIYNGGFDVTYDAEADVSVDLSGDNDYGALVGVAVAYSMADGAQKDALVAALEVYFTSSETEDLLAALENVSAAQVIAALKALANTTCEDMLTSLGFTSDSVVELEAVYGDLLDICGLVLSKLDITGPATTLKGFKVDGTYATYTFERENVRGYNVDVALSLKLFSEAGDITIEEPVVDLEASKGIIAGYEVEEEKDILFLDTKPEGLTVEEINHIIFEAENADKVEVTVLDREGGVRTDLICNGDTVKVVASNAKGSVTATYTIIIMGDTNADGVINIGDAYAVAQHYTGVIELDEVGLLAADMNQDGVTNVGDTYKMAIKYTSWDGDDDSYDSDLEQK